MNYAQKNKDRITFHKLMDFIKHPVYYKMKYIDMIIPEEDNENFLIGTAFEDKLRYDEKTWKSMYEIKEKGKKRTVKHYNEQNDDGRLEITATKGKMILKGIAEIRSQKLFKYDPKRSAVMLECEYKGHKIGGEVDEMIHEKTEICGKKYAGIISDIKTTRNLKSLRWDLIHIRDFGRQYIQQLAWYQFINQVELLKKDPELAPPDALYGGILKVASKEENPMSEMFFATPERLLEQRSQLLEALDRLIVCIETNDFGEMTREDLLGLNDAYPYHENKMQEEYTFI